MLPMMMIRTMLTMKTVECCLIVSGWQPVQSVVLPERVQDTALLQAFTDIVADREEVLFK